MRGEPNDIFVISSKFQVGPRSASNARSFLESICASPASITKPVALFANPTTRISVDISLVNLIDFIRTPFDDAGQYWLILANSD